MSKRRIGVIGLGMAAPPHAQSLIDLADRVEVVGCYSRTERRRSGFAARFPLPVTGDMEGLLQDPSVSALLILTPPNTHLDLVRRAASAGKHVLLEKPLDVTPERARAIVETMESAGLVLGVVFQHRFRPTALRLAEMIDEGRLGTLLSASASIRWWRSDAYFAEPGRGLKARDGGGVLLTQAIHTLDLFLSLAGTPLDVAGQAVTSPLRRIDTEDVVAAAVRFDGGAIGTIDATTVAYPGFPERIELAGTEGSAILSGERLEVFLKDGTRLEAGGDAVSGGGGADPMAFSYGPHHALHQDFLDALDEGRPPRVSGREALKVHALIEAILDPTSRAVPPA